MSEQRRALITGISGQDGSFLAEFASKLGDLVDDGPVPGVEDADLDVVAPGAALHLPVKANAK